MEIERRKMEAEKKAREEGKKDGAPLIRTPPGRSHFFYLGGPAYHPCLFVSFTQAKLCTSRSYITLIFELLALGQACP